MNIVWKPPVNFDDLNSISDMLRASPCIVATFDDFSGSDWKQFFFQHFEHGTDFYAHLDANFLSQLLRLFTKKEVSGDARVAAGLMSFAITFEMKVNPTFATHEYAFTGNDEPDTRLAGFYQIDNLHPQYLADIALGRCLTGNLPPLNDLAATRHHVTHRQHLRAYGLAYACLLKIVELHRFCGTGRSNDLSVRSLRAQALLDWMYHDYLFCASPLVIADQLWGTSRQKTVLKKIDSCDASNVLSMCKNAAWDLTLAENWANYESKRNPGDAFHLIFSFDSVLRELAQHLLIKPHQQSLTTAETIRQKYGHFWPEQVAEALAAKYLGYEATLEAPDRLWNTNERPTNKDFIAELENRLCEQLSA